MGHVGQVHFRHFGDLNLCICIHPILQVVDVANVLPGHKIDFTNLAILFANLAKPIQIRFAKRGWTLSINLFKGSRKSTPFAAQIAAEKVKSWLENVDLSGYTTAYAAFAHGDQIYADDWSKIQCPALVLTGTDDPNSTAEMAVQMASQARNGTAIVIENERHMVNLTAPDQVNIAMQAWLETQV